VSELLGLIWELQLAGQGQMSWGSRSFSRRMQCNGPWGHRGPQM